MASPNPVPPPPIPPYRPQRSISGPLILIAVGLVFLLATMHVLSLHSVWMWFGHYWPVLLIVLGLIKLVEHYQAQRTGTRSSGVGVGGAFLIVMLVVFGLIATQTSRVDWEALRNGMHMDDDSDWGWFEGHAYTYDDHLEQDFPAGAMLRVTDTRGAVNITTSDSAKIQVGVRKTIRAESQNEADRWNGNTKPDIKVSGNTVTLNANTQGAGDHSVTIDLDISVPRNVAVNITNRSGDVSVLGRDGDVEISNQKGDVSVTDVKGKVTLSLENSSARISQITGDVSAEGRMKEVSLDTIKGAARLNGDFTENVDLSKISKTVTLKSARTDIEIAKLDGDLSLDSHDLRASTVTGPFRLLTKFKDIRLEGVSGDLRLENEDGAVEVQMTKMGAVQIDNRRSDISIYVPDKAAFQVNAQTKNGEIESDFTGLNVSNGDERATASGSVGGGGPRLVVNNEHGAIEIRKRSMIAEKPERPEKPEKPEAPEATDN
jgi:Toastrack DUF4097/LiaF transmembrane domain